MMIAGSPHLFAQGLLPTSYIADILALVVTAWRKVVLPPATQEKRLEPRISALLKDQLVEELDAASSHLPFLVFPEIQKTDPITGKQFARTDIEVHCRDIKIASQKPYFTWESKRLRVPDNKGSVTPNTGEYLKEMASLVADEKQTHPSFCGMLGFVMDGDVNAAHTAIQTALAKNPPDLLLSSPHQMTAYGAIPHPPHGQTVHIYAVGVAGLLTIYHLLLAVAP